MRCLRPPLRTALSCRLGHQHCVQMIVFDHVSLRYPGTEGGLRDASFSISQGELVVLSGHSGAGKSSLLKLIPAIERPSSGRVLVGDQDVGRLPRQAIAFLRRRIGLVLQESRLLLDRDIFDNVMLPLLITGHSATDAAKRANAALDRVGLSGRGKEMPLALSGGEQQRAAIARAVVNRPSSCSPTSRPPTSTQPTRDIAALFQSFHAAGVTVISPPMTRTCSRTCVPRRMTLNRGQLSAGRSPHELARRPLLAAQRAARQLAGNLIGSLLTALVIGIALACPGGRPATARQCRACPGRSVGSPEISIFMNRKAGRAAKR